ncbi:hypothetical protein MNBD_ALPHA07-1244 [hydrothermal vent metagenome]|uniref:DUF1330 domain-containing protein n=1 Tax=hydrothermal vent metagenome TaxID=652676 RepID=A0A3B0SU06_9ZZZZ
MPAIMIALNTINRENPEALAAYADGAMPLIKAAGGKLAGRYVYEETIVGGGFPDVVFTVEFPSAQIIKDLFNSEAYQALIPHRNKAFTSFNVCICNAP